MACVPQHQARARSGNHRTGGSPGRMRTPARGIHADWALGLAWRAKRAIGLCHTFGDAGNMS
jgi:hypothetical protein